MLFTAVALGVLGCESISSVWAADAINDSVDPYTKAYNKCSDDAQGLVGASAIVAGCSESVTQMSDSVIHKLFRHIHTQIMERSPADARLFEQAQRDWLSYRDKHCQLMGGYVGSPMYNYCPMLLNIARIKELEELAQ